LIFDHSISLGAFNIVIVLKLDELVQEKISLAQPGFPLGLQLRATFKSLNL